MRARVLLSACAVVVVAASLPVLAGSSAAAPPLPLANDSFSWVLPGAGSSPVNTARAADGGVWTTLLGSHQLARTDRYGSTRLVDLPAGSAPLGIAVGPDGNIWFTETGTNKIGRVAPDATGFIEFPIPTPASNPVQIAPGVDGDLWFTEADADKIARITTAGDITEHAVPHAASKPTGIVVTGAGITTTVWFTEFATNRVVSFSVDTTSFSPIDMPTPNSQPAQLAELGDGALAVTQYAASKIAIIRSGAVTEYATPTPAAFPLGIAPAVGGGAWFGEWDAMNVGFIDATGHITEHRVTTNGTVGLTDVVAASATEVWYVSNKENRVGRLTIEPSPFTVFPLDDDAGPFHLTAGPDGAMWYTRTDNHIGRTTMAGASTTYPVPSPNDEAGDIAVGPDGALWFTEVTAGKIGRIDLQGNVTEHDIPTADSRPGGITAGPGGMWFTEPNADKVGRIDMAGNIVEFPVPTAGSRPLAITAGPDGNLWFTEAVADKIARIAPAGVVTEFAVPPGTEPQGIAAGPDGNLWFSGFNGANVGRVTPTGQVTSWPNFAIAQGMAPGPDGNMWYADLDGWIDNVTTAGERRGHWYGNTDVTDVATGPDGNIWFANLNGDRIGRYRVRAPVDATIRTSSPTVAPGGTVAVTVPVTARGPDDVGCLTVSTTTTQGTVTTADADVWAPAGGSGRRFRGLAGCPLLATSTPGPDGSEALPSVADVHPALTLPAGTTSTSTFTAAIPADAAAGSTVTLTASITGSTPGTAATATATVTVAGQAPPTTTASPTTTAPPSGALPATGAGGATLPLAVWGFALVAVGGACHAFAWRARRPRRRA